ncbi:MULTISPECIES: hypothetical protein [Bradyrhizobium]|uniref:Uncharacterized protein n=1 Tax=Bradyrhizobium uaiense TaxID=2594946 RepID=A0A6P1BBN3_9BRAD|nr:MULTISPECIES: hypothetical protein [Bradyrhizobium]MCC8980260.1 hypothetical protein [Bradyrhizobium acaciae]NEU95683.1 hypothetical protein [Bradyrhizobium uaiense]
MRTSTIALLIAAITATAPIAAAQNLQNEADKGAKTRNSGESGYVGDQQRSGAAATPPGRPDAATGSTDAATSPSAQNSGTGISGAPGNKNGPPPGQSTVGSGSQNLHVQEQDPSNVKGLPGNKSGPPAKR